MSVSSTSNIPDHLILTKLYPPRVPELLVSRQHLIDRLNSDVRLPLTLISAPAGYGKSTLACQWLEATGEPYAWLSLDEQDDELDALLEYLIAALRMIYPQLGSETEGLLMRLQRPQPERLADSLLRDLHGLPVRVCLAVDDYHVIKDEDVHHFMARLVQRLPLNLCLVLVSRMDPPLPLARLRGRRQLREIRAGQLRFSPGETTVLLEQIMGQRVTEETVSLVNERTEGWPVGLRMAAMSLRDSPDKMMFLERYRTGGQKLVSDYLLSEVLESLPEGQHDLLLKTSILDRLNAPLVDVLSGDTGGGQDFLDLLWASNLFLIALDEQGEWYRYHQLFRQLLQQRLAKEFSSNEIAELHLRTGAWFGESGLVEAAIAHYIACDAGDRAARIVERNANQEQWRVLDRWIKLLPMENRMRPGILAIRAALENLYFRVKTVPPLLTAARKGLASGETDYSPQEATSWEGVIDLYEGLIFDAGNPPR